MLRYALFGMFLVGIFSLLGLVAAIGVAFGLQWMFAADAVLYLLALWVERRVPLIQADWLPGAPRLPPAMSLPSLNGRRRAALPPPTRLLPPPGNRS